MSDSYCDHIKTRASYRVLNNPRFLAGGLILPPDRPGWKNASIDEVASVSDDEKHRIYSEIAQESPHLSPADWEKLMIEILSMMKMSEMDDDVEDDLEDDLDSPSATHLAKKVILNIPKLF
jgi:hypothetical protein